MAELAITDEQAMAFGKLIQKEGLCDIQLGLSSWRPNALSVWTQKGPHLPTKHFDIDPDGGVVTSA